MKSVINELGNKTLLSKVICVFHLFSSFLMSHHTEHLIYKAWAPLPLTMARSRSLQPGADGHISCRPRWAPPLKEVLQGLCLVWAGCWKACHYNVSWDEWQLTAALCRKSWVLCWGRHGDKQLPGRQGRALARGLPSGVWISLLGLCDKMSQTGWLKQRNLLSHSSGC